MTKSFSRLARFEEKRAYRRLLLSLLGSVVIISALVFLGLPALVKFSVLLGSLKGDSGTNTQQQDDTLPFPPRLEASYTATNSATVSLSGYAEPRTTLQIFLNGETYKEFLISQDGQFNLRDVPLREGENKVTSIAKDAAGNSSQPSTPLVITYKNKPPLVEISEPQEGQVYNKDEKEIKIKGQTELGNSVYINGRLVVVLSDGSFIYSLPLNPGENILKIVVTDIAGNQTTVERKVIFTE